MTVTARKYALLNRISPKVRHLIGLYFLEIAVILSWTLLMDTLFNLISGKWFLLLPVSYLLSVTMLAWLERSRTGSRGHSPLEAFSLAEIDLDGFRPTEWQTLIRLLLTPPLMLLLGLGLIPVPSTGKTILQMISKSRIVPLDTDMDPRSAEEIFGSRRKALMKVISYTMVSLMVTAVIILVPPELIKEGVGDRISSIHSLPEEERELLASYLEMKSMYPDSIEFHVRLASLYYRNDMEEDLLLELNEIRRIDPNHSILMLEADLTITMDDLMVRPDSMYDDSIPVIIIDTTPPVPEDTAEHDSLVPLPDSVSLDLRLVASDSTAASQDSLPEPDSTETIDSTIRVDDPTEIDSLSVTPADDLEYEIVVPPAPPDESPSEVNPDSIVIEDTSSIEAVDSTETVPDSIPPEPEGT